MRLIITSDLHYNVLRSKQPTLELAERLRGLRADALLILGDAAGQDASIVRECLQLFDGFAGRKFFVAGNHELWAAPGESSLDRYERTLPEICRQTGFHDLDLEPVVLGNVGLVGSVGWYDYSFRPANLNIPMRFYEAKIAPGAASRTERYSHLLATDHDVPPDTLRIGTRWMDGEHVRLPMSDPEFCDYLLDRLRRHLDQVAPHCERIVAALHHVPFRELVRGNPNPSWAFAEAYLGSEAFGQVLVEQPKVRHVFCGHTHQAGRITRGHLECINTGCTYMEKRYEVLEL
jgi:3',5'-cyclic AMP phosphodiesterase CpdA